MDGNRPSDVLSPECPSRQVLRHLTSTWGVLVLIVLLKGEHRFSALKRRVGGVSERMLAQTLQQLEGDGMVLRVAHSVVPPHVVYSLTDLGQGAALRVQALVGWLESALDDRAIASGDGKIGRIF
jgi:DNA-binding HxlR family transcriptional regulator